MFGDKCHLAIFPGSLAFPTSLTYCRWGMYISYSKPVWQRTRLCLWVRLPSTWCLLVKGQLSEWAHWRGGVPARILRRPRRRHLVGLFGVSANPLLRRDFPSLSISEPQTQTTQPLPKQTDQHLKSSPENPWHKNDKQVLRQPDKIQPSVTPSKPLQLNPKSIPEFIPQSMYQAPNREFRPQPLTLATVQPTPLPDKTNKKSEVEALQAYFGPSCVNVVNESEIQVCWMCLKWCTHCTFQVFIKPASPSTLLNIHALILHFTLSIRYPYQIPEIDVMNIEFPFVCRLPAVDVDRHWCSSYRTWSS